MISEFNREINVITAEAVDTVDDAIGSLTGLTFLRSESQGIKNIVVIIANCWKGLVSVKYKKVLFSAGLISRILNPGSDCLVGG